MSESSQVESREDPLEEGGDANITVDSNVAASASKSSCLEEPACTDEEVKETEVDERSVTSSRINSKDVSNGAAMADDGECGVMRMDIEVNKELDEKTELAKQIAEIVDREKRNMFPLVPSYCQNALDPKVAEDLSVWALKMNHVKFQSFLDACYNQYRRSHQLPAGENLILARLNFMRDVYYVKLLEWRVKKFKKKFIKKLKITQYESRVTQIAGIYADDLEGGNALTVTGHIVDMDDEPRTVDTMDHKIKAYVKKRVLNCTIVDSSNAAARLDCWGDLADTVHTQLHHEVADAPVAICFTFLVASKEDKSVRPFKKLTATKKTTFSNANIALPDKTGQLIPEKLYVSLFDALIVAMPYVTNVRGIVAACETTISADGTEMKHFELVDTKGNSVEMTAFGRHGGNPLLSSGSEVIIFIVTALIKDGATHGHLWVYDKAHVVQRRANATVPQNRKLIHLVRK